MPPVSQGTEEVDALRRLFVNRPDAYPLQMDSGSYVAVREEVTDDLLLAHLRGRITLGAYAVARDGSAKWLCFDSDREGGEEDLRVIQSRAESLGITAYLEGSRRGGHLWVFTEPAGAAAVRSLGRRLSEGFVCEIYPKATYIEEDGLGSQVRLPLGVHKKTGKRYPFVSLQTIKVNKAKDIYRLGYKSVVGRVLNGPRRHESTAGVDAFDWIDRNLTPLDQRGCGSCPLHPPDRSRSFNVSRQKGLWVCYHQTQENGKYLGGTLPKLVMLLNNVGYREALEIIERGR